MQYSKAWTWQMGVIFLSMYLCLSYGQSEAQRLVVVLGQDWQSSNAQLYCLEQTQVGWNVVDQWDVKIGRNGLGWSQSPGTLGYHCPWPNSFPLDGPIKQEGDGKSPAGILFIRRQCYGYQEKAPDDFQWPYTHLTSDWIGVDDPQSLFYNRLLDQRTISQQDWQSYEVLRRKDHVYRWFLMIEHNTNPVIPGAGSCIFIHIWRNPFTATAGCTAMPEARLLQLIQWLQPESQLWLIQLPQEVYAESCADWHLPELK